MTLSKIINLLLPPIFVKLWRKIFPKNQPKIVPLPKLGRGSQKMVVIGNGPSLNNTVNIYMAELHDSECVMVNDSVKTELFGKIRPCMFLLVDPKYYKAEGYETFRPTLISIVDAIVLQTLWPMKIIMPRSAIGSYAVERFKENPNLHILFYEDGWEKPNDISQFEAWDKNLIAPPAQTVLNTAVWLSIYMGYPETYIVGADTSWHTELKMDQETNELYTIDTHFYNNKEMYGDLYDEKQNRRPIRTKLHEELFAEATALKEYCELRKYADWKGVKVYNACEYSWIDAFERKKLK